MEKTINFILLSINAYADYPGRDMAGTMRVKNLFDPLLKDHHVAVSNLVMLDVLEMEHHGRQGSVIPTIDCLSIGYRSLTKPLSLQRFIRQGMKFIKSHHRQDAANIIYNYQYPDIRNFLLIIYARYKGFKIVFDLVEDKKYESVKTFSDKIRVKLSLLFLKLMPYYADGIFVISNQLMMEMAPIIKDKVPLYLLPICVNFSLIDNNKQVKDINEPVRIFYGGSFAQKDGLEYLLGAVSILEKKNYRFRLVLSGKGKPDDMELFFANTANSSLVDYRGFLSTEAYFKLLNSADICCIARNNSAFANAGFPFKMGEFLAAGKVIVASRVGDIEKYVTHMESAFLVDPSNTEDLASGLAYCLDNLEKLSSTMGKKARAVALKYFESEASSKYLLEKCISINNKSRK